MNAAAAPETSSSRLDNGEDESAGLIQNIQLYGDNLNADLEQIKNKFESQLNHNQNIILKYEEVVPEYQKLRRIRDEATAVIVNCGTMFKETDDIRKKAYQQVQNNDVLETRRTLDNINKLGCVIQNNINLKRRKNEEVLHQRKLKIAENEKKKENLFKSFEQKKVDLVNKISKQNVKILLMHKKNEQLNKSVSKAMQNENALAVKLADIEGIYKSREIEETTKIKELKILKMRTTDLEQNLKSEEDTLNVQLEFMTKREEEENKVNLSNLIKQEKNQALQIKNLDVDEYKLTEEANLLKQKISKVQLLIEDCQADNIELETNYQIELDVLSNIYLDIELQHSKEQTLNEELILKLKTFDDDKVERKKLICSLKREIDEEKSISNKNIKYVEILDTELALGKLIYEEKRILNTLKLQLQEKKDDLNRKSESFTEETRKIHEEHEQLQISSNREIEKYKMEVENKCQATAKHLEDIENSNLNEIEDIKKSMELINQATKRAELEIENIENEYFVVEAKCEFYQEKKNKQEKLMKEQQKTKKTSKRKEVLIDDNDNKSDSSYGIPFEDLFKNKIFSKKEK